MTGRKVQDVVVVGAGAAGVATAETVRRLGHRGRITLLGDEVAAPYDRPPLSKGLLDGTLGAEDLALRPPVHYADLGIELLQGRRATALDPRRSEVRLDDGANLPFDALVIATGVGARQPFRRDLAGVHVLRTVEDGLALRAALRGRPRVVVVGAGLIGTEVAAAARRLGLDTTVVDPLPVPLHRQLGPLLGERIAREHRARGVTFRLGVGVRGLVPGVDAGTVGGVALTDGEVVPADCVVVAVGSTPATGWLASSGLPLGDGVECDVHLQAAPGIWAVGDVASWPSARHGRRIRVEHRVTAAEHAIAVAGDIVHGTSTVLDPVPYFWTDQWDVTVHGWGVFPADATVVPVEGDLDGERFLVEYHEPSGVVGVLGWNAARQARRHWQHLQREQALAPSPDGYARSAG